MPPIGGLAAKLSDREKFKSTLELLGGLEKPIDKDGYQLYLTPIQDGRGDIQIAIGSEFICQILDTVNRRRPSNQSNNL